MPRMKKPELVAKAKAELDSILANVAGNRDPKYRRLARAYYRAKYEWIITTPSRKIIAFSKLHDAQSALELYQRQYIEAQNERMRQQHERGRKAVQRLRDLLARTDIPPDDKLELGMLLDALEQTMGDDRFDAITEIYFRRVRELMAYDEHGIGSLAH